MDSRSKPFNLLFSLYVNMSRLHFPESGFGHFGQVVKFVVE